MHAIHEYSNLLKAVLQQATQMVHALPAGYHLAAGHDILNFLRYWGCEGYPSDQVGQFTLGPWLTRPGQPAQQHEAITIIPCFSDDIPPMAQPTGKDAIFPGVYSRGAQIILLYDAEQWSLPEVALTVLHEGRHARHRIGPHLIGLPPLDQNESHEANTWLFTLNVLNAWGGKTWAVAVEQESAWLQQQSLQPGRAGQLKYAGSKHDWPELDQLFGVSRHARVSEVRRTLVTLSANIVYWSQRLRLPPEQVCYSLVTHFYK